VKVGQQISYTIYDAVVARLPNIHHVNLNLFLAFDFKEPFYDLTGGDVICRYWRIPSIETYAVIIRKDAAGVDDLDPKAPVYSKISFSSEVARDIFRFEKSSKNLVSFPISIKKLRV
jgi:hypothetical protein